VRFRSQAFPLLRYFALLSFGCMLLVAVPMGYILHRYSQGALEKIAEERNVGYASFLGNAVWPAYRNFFTRAADMPAPALQHARETVQLMERLSELSRSSSVVKVKIYNPAGRVIFSSHSSQIGVMQASNHGMQSALTGQILSEMTHRNTFDTFEQMLVDRDVLSSYVPLYDGGRVAAVFEVYTDITPFIGQMIRLRNAVGGTVGIGVLLLYLMLSVLIWRAKMIIDRQQDQLDRSMGSLAETNRSLETRVDERTQELTEANQRLLGEVEERRRAETNLKLAATVFENTAEGVVIADRDQKVLAVNRAFTEITGFSSNEVEGRRPRFLQSGRQNARVYRNLWDSLAERGGWTGEIWSQRKNGEVYPEWLSISAVHDEYGELTHYVGVFSDISEIKRSQARLEFLAHHDSLTGLPNRVLLNTRITEAIAASGGGLGFSLLFIDLDHFKHVNDTLGHPLGDRLLVAVAAVLRTELGIGGEAEAPPIVALATVARLGGDEFVAVLPPDDQPDSAERAAERILAALAKPFQVEGHELFIGASIGIVRYPADGTDADTLLARADVAMYCAKGHGRNIYEVYGRHMAQHAHERLALAGVLRRAIDEDRLFLEYQPQINLDTDAIVGVEALVRLRHPTLGVISPARFIELAEEDGFISELGLWVLREACFAMKRWRSAGLAIPHVAVNVSVAQLERGELPEVLADLLATTRLPPSAIELEITESAIMNTDNAIEKLKRLREIGVSLAIDDFGTGYSSLSYLRKLPVQKLKIDRSFFLDMAQHEDAATIVRTVIGLARNLGLKTVAEGVEGRAQGDFLRAEGCQIVQGFLYSRPLSETDLVAFVHARSPAKALAQPSPVPA
jgi:diguanylate cyclase (GGDEF)-like protein/PAS domain S-box-containing protein